MSGDGKENKYHREEFLNYIRCAFIYSGVSNLWNL